MKYIQTPQEIRRVMLRFYVDSFPELRLLKNLPFFCFGIKTNRPSWIWPIRSDLYIVYTNPGLAITDELPKHYIAPNMAEIILSDCPPYRSYYAKYWRYGDVTEAFVLELKMEQDKLLEWRKSGIAACEFEEKDIKEKSFF